MELQHRRGDIYNTDIEEAPLPPSAARKSLCLEAMALRKARQARICRGGQSWHHHLHESTPFLCGGQNLSALMPPSASASLPGTGSLHPRHPLNPSISPHPCSPAELSAANICPREDWSNLPWSPSLLHASSNSFSICSLFNLSKPKSDHLAPCKEPFNVSSFLTGQRPSFLLWLEAVLIISTDQ